MTGSEKEKAAPESAAPLGVVLNRCWLHHVLFAAFLEEKSPRADVARTLIRLVSISARVSTELEELKRSQKMSSLWKLHADSIVILLDMANTSTEEAGSVAKTAEQNGAGGAARAIHESVQKLRNQADIAVKTLANVS